MIHFDPPAEPAEFDTKVRKPGNEWLARYYDSNNRPRDYWSQFKSLLAEGFSHLCAYSAMFEPVGTVDHYLSWKNKPELAYEWSNYRYASAWVNSSKSTVDSDVMDPFEVENNWFEIILPSLQLVVTNQVPASMREKAQFTLKRLHLQNGENVMRQRHEWYISYLEGMIPLEFLDRMAPLIARAIRKQNNRKKDLLNDTDVPTGR